jgi:uridine kinase
MPVHSDIVDFKALAQQIEQGTKASARIVIGIDGPGASGKSTFARQLALSLNCAHVVHVDDFFFPTAQCSDRAGQVGPLFDLPRLAQQVITPSRTTEAFRYQRYDWTEDRLAEWVNVPESVPIIVEGVFSLAEELRDAYTYKVWCRADPAIRLVRGLARDGEEARSIWLDVWMPAEDEYAATQSPEQKADLVVDSSPSSGDHQFFLIHASE